MLTALLVLLQGWIKFGLALGAEFLGVFLFAWAGSAVPAGSQGSGNVSFAICSLVYMNALLAVKAQQ